MVSRRDAVLDTTELLEAILLNLDMRTLLTSAQRVSRRWRELITSSPALKRALYFEPASSSSWPVTQNPLLAEAFPLWFRNEMEQPTRNQPPSSLLAEVFPLWFRNEMGQSNRNRPPNTKSIRQGDFGRLPMAQESRRYAFTRPDATWRHMLVRQPPALKLGHWTMRDSMIGRFSDCQALDFPDGLRMGSLYDKALHWILRRPMSGFNVFWDPTAAAAHGYSQGIGEEEREKVREFAGEVGVVLFCFMVQQCDPEPPDWRFERAFTFAPSKEQLAWWDLLESKLAERDLSTGHR